jgi:hypothetical protein
LLKIFLLSKLVCAVGGKWGKNLCQKNHFWNINEGIRTSLQNFYNSDKRIFRAEADGLET